MKCTSKYYHETILDLNTNCAKRVGTPIESVKDGMYNCWA